MTTRTTYRLALGSALALLGGFGYVAAQPVGGTVDRTVLPVPEPDYPRETVLDARDAKAPPRFEVKPPKSAPNVIVFLIDDIGFGHPSTFGGGIPMPWSEEITTNVWSYTPRSSDGCRRAGRPDPPIRRPERD